ncbi:uncharacterized protein OCT59_014566 [Rhizophagus irregularis]|uniref:uncharacterized protein n=1 Tax=Rhizophagus irregularis TaxID=588596 RepID=UPI0033282580|nr:hypothetical protein OCT59_014566 [Rhizophagus irregularis]
MRTMKIIYDWLDFFVRTEFRISFRSSYRPAFQEPIIIVLKAFHNIGQHNNHAFYPTPSFAIVWFAYQIFNPERIPDPKTSVVFRQLISR